MLSFDFAGLGRSGGDFADSSFSADVADLHAAADYLVTNVVAPSLLVGHSLGGAAVLSAAPGLPSVKAVATIGAPADPAHVLHLLDGDLDAIRRDGSAPVTISGRTFTVGRSFLDDLEARDPRERIAGFKGATMIMHAPKDELVGIDNAERLYHAARHPKSFVSLDDADHLLTRDDDAHYVATLIAAWAQRYLPATEPAESAYGEAGAVARNEKGFATRLDSRGFTLRVDEPADMGGTETGPTPYDYLAMALASCTAMTTRVYAQGKKWRVGEIGAAVTHNRVHAKDCQDCEHTTGRVDRLERTLHLPEGLTQEQRDSLVRIADRCPVHLTLEGQIEVHTELDS